MPWGEGDGSLLDWSPDAVWLVFGAVKHVDIGDKSKVPECVVVHVGNQQSATDFIARNGGAGRAIVGYSATAGYCGTATAGYYGIIVIRYHDDARYRLAIGYVGEDGILANTPYHVVNARLEPVK